VELRQSSSKGVIQVLKNWKWAMVLAAVAALSACGGSGSGSDPTPKGAIAINPSTGFGAISVNHTSQPEANSRVVDACGGGAVCLVALQFSGHGRCGSIAWSAWGWGVGSGGSQEAADQNAVASCVERGGGGSCVKPAWLHQQCH